MTFAVGTEHNVVSEVHIANKPHTKSVFRDEGKTDTQFSDLGGSLLFQVDFVVVVIGVNIVDVTVFRSIKTCDGFKKFSLTTACDACDAEDFPCSCGESDVFKSIVAFHILEGEAFNHKSRDRTAGLTAVDVQFNLAAHHHFGQFSFSGFSGVDGGDMLTLAEDCHSVADCHNFVQFVGYDDD